MTYSYDYTHRHVLFGMSESMHIYHRATSYEHLAPVSYTHLDVYKRQLVVLGIILSEWRPRFLNRKQHQKSTHTI